MEELLKKPLIRFELGKPWESNNLFCNLFVCVNYADVDFRGLLKLNGRIIREDWEDDAGIMTGEYCYLYNGKLKEFKNVLSEKLISVFQLDRLRYLSSPRAKENEIRDIFHFAESKVWNRESWSYDTQLALEKYQHDITNKIILKNINNTKETKMNLISIKEAAEKINIPSSELYNYIKKGKLKSWKRGKRSLFIDVEDLMNFKNKIEKSKSANIIPAIKQNPNSNGNGSKNELEMIMKKLDEINNYEHISQKVLKIISETNGQLEKINFCVKRIYEDLYGIK